MFAELLTIVVPVLVAAAIGYTWARWSGQPFPVDFTANLITWVGAPCLVFHVLANLSLPPAVLAAQAGAALAVVVANAAIGAPILALLRYSQRAYLPAVMFANIGNMGLPLCYLAFGEEGLALAIVVFAVNASLMFTLGAAIAAGSFSPRVLLRLPFLYAVVLALAFQVSGFHPPDFLNATTKLLGDFTIPLMLITLGVSLAQLGVRHLSRSLIVALLRLSVGFAASLAVATVLALDGVARGALILQSSMPVAVFNYLFAQRYGTEPEAVAGVVVISTLMSFLTLPLLLWFVL
jgi:predicted permease